MLLDFGCWSRNSLIGTLIKRKLIKKEHSSKWNTHQNGILMKMELIGTHHGMETLISKGLSAT